MKKRYSIGGQIFEIPDTEVNAFLKDNPNATEVKFYSVGGKDYNIPLTEVEDFEKEMGIKKKGSPLFQGISQGVGSILQAGGQVGNGKAPLKEEISAVEDPAKYLLQPYRERKTAAEKEYQKNLPIGGYNLMAIPKANTKQDYDVATKDLTTMEEQVYNKLFPDTRHAISYIQQKYDQMGGKVPENNETFKIALQKVNQRKVLDDIVSTSGSIDEAAAKYYGDDFNNLADVKKGRYLRSFLNRPEVKEKADEGGQFLHDYNIAKGTLISKYPQDALQKIATDISQELEDKKMTGWFYSNPGIEKTDKAVQQLVDEGKMTLEEKNVYDKALRPIIEAGGADVVLKTSDLTHAIGRGLYHGMENLDATLRDVTNRVTGGVFQKAGLIETNEDRRKRLESERLSQTELQPKGARKFLTEAGEFTGFSIPMIFGSMAKVPQAMNMALMFEGANADKARELFKDDAGKQDLYTLLSTGADMYLMKLLPTKKIAEGAKNLLSTDIKGLINELGSGKITQEQASKTFLDNLTNYAKKVGVTNFETANALTAFQLAHNTIDAAFGKRDFHLESEVKEALTNYKTNFLSGTFLSMVGAAPKSNEINTNGKILRELADKSEQVLPEIKNDAEKTKNLQTAIQINNELKTRDWNEDAKNKFMASAMKEAVLKEKQKTAPTEALKKQSEEELDRAKKTQEAILAGKNPDEVKTDNEIELERLQKDKELKDKEFAAKRKDLDGRTPEDRPKIEKLEEDKKRADEDYQREVEKLIPKVKPEETFPEGQTVPDEKITETIPEQQPQAISSGEQVGDRQSQINDLMDDVRAFNKLPKNAKNRSYELNQLRLRANDLNLEFDDSYGKLYTKEGKSVHKISSDKPSSLSPDFNEQEYSDETKQHAKILLDNPDALNGLPILGNDGRQLSRKQMESALKSVQEGKPSRAAKSMYDFIEDAVRNGNVEVTDRTTGQSVKVPTDEYFSTFKEPVKELTDEEIMQLNWELSEDSFNFNDEYHGQEIIPSETQSTSAGKTKASAEELSSPTKTPTVSGETSPQIVNEKSQIEIQQSPEVKELTVTDVNKEVGEAEKGTAEPPPEKPTEPVVEEGGEGVGITHAQTKELAQEFGLSEYEKSPETFEKWDREAEERIKNGEMPKLIQRLKKGEIPSSVEQRMMGKYIAELAAKAEKDASDENLNNLHEAIKLSDVIGGREAGKTLVSRKGTFLPDDSLAAYFELERTSNLDAPLTDGQKEKAKTEWERISKAKEDFEKYVFEKESEISAKMAAAKIAEARKGVTSAKTKEKRSHEDFKKERDSYREELKKAKEAHEQWLKEQGIQKQGFGFTLTTDMVKAIAKIVKSHVEEGVQKLEEIIEKVYEDLKDIFPAIEKKDIQDVIAGVYNEKKPPRKELARRLFELRQQAQLISKLEKLYAGEEPKSEKKKVQRNQEIEKLRKQIKDIESFDSDVKKIKEEEVKSKAAQATEVEKELNKAEREEDKKEKDRIAAAKLEEKMLSKEITYRTPEEKALEKYKNATTKRISELEEQLRTGDFEKTTKKIPIQLDRQGRELQHKLIKLKTERQIRLMKQEYQNRSKVDKARDWVADKLNVPRTIMSSMDFSAPLRQGLVAAISHPRTATLAGLQMFKSAFSKKNFDKWVYENRESPRFDIQNQSGLAITDPHSPYLAAKEEAFMNNTAEKIPLIGRLIAGSERAYVMFLNKMRVDLFNRFADRFEEQGKTFENSPELYKAMAKLINAETGRGDLGKALEGAAPILNSAFFSPRLIASRVNLLSNWANPYWYKRTPKEIRIMYLKDMLKTVGLGMSVLMLAKLNGAQVEDDPRSTDFGKIKSGNTRWDVWGGFQQYVRLVTQLVLGQKKAATTGTIQELDSRGKFGESRGDVALRFLRGKLAPVPSMLMDWSAGRTATGEKVTLGNELESHFTPLLYSDIKDAWKDKGVRSVFEVGIPSMFGVGVQTFAPRPPSAKTITVSDITGLNERQATPEEYKKYQDEVEKKFKEQLTSYEKGEIEVPISLVKSEQFPKGKPVLMTSDNWSGKTIPYKELDEESKKYFQRILKNPISKQVRENMKMKTDEEEQ